MKDQDILDLYWNRNEKAVFETEQKYGNYCRSIAHNILHSKEDSEECVNDTWVRAWNSIPPNRPKVLSSFLGKITRNLSINRFKMYSAAKRGGCRVEIALHELENCVPQGNSIEQEFDEAELSRLINAFLHEQPLHKRNIFIRRYWYMSSIKEISQAYGITEAKVASLLFRMRNSLRQYLETKGVDL